MPSKSSITKHTVKKEYTDVVVDPHLMIPKTVGSGEIYATFYLYIE
jgi:hypothetical protein